MKINSIKNIQKNSSLASSITLDMNTRKKQINILVNCKNQLEQICSNNKHDSVHNQKPHTKSLKKDDRDMRPRDKLRRKRLKDEKNEELF